MRTLQSRTWKSLLVAGMLSLAVGSSYVMAQDSPAANKKDAPALQKDAQSDALLHKVADFYKSVKTASVNFDTHVKISGPAQNRQIDTKTSFAVERPNKLSIIMTDGGSKNAVVSDGKNLWTSIPQLKKYSEEKAPGTLAAITEAPATSAIAQQATLVMALFADEPYDKLLDSVDKISYLGEKELDGVKVKGVHMEMQDMDYDLWFNDGDQPLVHKIVPDMSRQLAERAKTVPQLQGMKIDASILTNDWAINKPSTADQFAFTPPAGSAKVDTAEDIFAPPQHPLVGKVAPAVDVKLLDGGEFKLADHKGKDVVIIDFWATWCGPCVQSLPIINQVAKDYADKGVVFYAMNIREDDATIKPFLAQHKLDMTVALDSDGSVATEYQASGIPQTVIVDRNGVIHAIHVGMSPNLKASLSKDLDSALAVKVKAD